MPAFTTHLNLYLPGGGSLGIGGDDEEADVDKINQNMQKIDDWADDTDDRLGILDQQLTRNQQFTDIAANIGTVVGMKLGDTYQETDGNKVLWRYDGANWITNESGMYLVRPASVTGAGVVLNVDGSVTATNAPLVALNGVFSSRFKYYELRWAMDKATAASAVLLRMRNAGADDAANNYHLRRMGTGGGGYSEATTGPVSSFEFSIANYSTQVADIKLVNPAASAFHTRIFGGTSFDTNGSSFAQTAAIVGEHRVASAFDGFSLSLSGANLTGDVRVYGLA